MGCKSTRKTNDFEIFFFILRYRVTLYLITYLFKICGAVRLARAQTKRAKKRKPPRKQEIIIFMTNKRNKFITLFPPHFYSFLFNVMRSRETKKKKEIMRLYRGFGARCADFFPPNADLMNENCFWEIIILTFHFAIFCAVLAY